jgi:hypothetical protein
MPKHDEATGLSTPAPNSLPPLEYESDDDEEVLIPSDSPTPKVGGTGKAPTTSNKRKKAPEAEDTDDDGDFGESIFTSRKKGCRKGEEIDYSIISGVADG